MKAIVKKNNLEGFTLKFVYGDLLERPFGRDLINSDKFSLELFTHEVKDKLGLTIHIVRCETCRFNEFYEDREGFKNGKPHIFKLGKCNCEKIEWYKRIGCHLLDDDWYPNCTFYISKK